MPPNRSNTDFQKRRRIWTIVSRLYSERCEKQGGRLVTLGNGRFVVSSQRRFAISCTSMSRKLGSRAATRLFRLGLIRDSRHILPILSRNAVPSSLLISSLPFSIRRYIRVKVLSISFCRELWSCVASFSPIRAYWSEKSQSLLNPHCQHDP